MEITAKLGAELSEADGVQFSNVRIEAVSGKAFVLRNVSNFRMDGKDYPNASSLEFDQMP
jgi:hypothetical protein